jgi:hemolysin D
MRRIREYIVNLAGRASGLAQTQLQKMQNQTVEFLPDADAIEQSPINKNVPVTIYSLLAMMVLLISWATFSELDQVVIAKGRLTSTAPNIVIQPIETGQIDQLNVTIGQVVKKGEVIATLEPTFIVADLAQTKERFSSLDAQVKRLEAEAKGIAYKRGESENELLQSNIERDKVQAYKSKMVRFDENIDRVKTQIKTNETEVANLHRRVQSLTEIESMNQALMNQGFQSRRDYLDSMNSRLSVERELQVSISRSFELKNELNGLMADRQSFDKEHRQRNNEELVNAKRERDSLQEQLSKVARRNSLITVISPTDGVVLEVIKKSKGSVIREGETLAVIVQDGGELEAEINISSAEISIIKLNDKTRVKIDSFPFQRYGLIIGKLSKLSKDTSEAGENQDGKTTYYKARVRLEEFQGKMQEDKKRLVPGMSLTGEIVTNKRSVLSYITYPLRMVGDEAMNER